MMGLFCAALRRRKTTPQPDLPREHGRLVGRLKRQIARYEAHGADAMARNILHTTTLLIVLERRMADPLAEPQQPTLAEVAARVRLMAPGAGIEVPR